MDSQGYEDEYGEQYQLQDQGVYDGDGAGYVQQDQIIVGSNPNASSLFRSEEMALCQLFLQVRVSKQIDSNGPLLILPYLKRSFIPWDHN